MVPEVAAPDGRPDPEQYPSTDQETDSAAVAEDAETDFEAEVSADIDESENMWPDFVHHLVEDWPRIGSMLSAAKLVSSKGSTIELRFDSNGQFQFQEVTNKKNRDHILKELEKHFGRPVELHITIENRQPAGPAVPASAAVQPQGGSIQDDIAREPIIQSVLEMFDGEVLD